MATLVLAPPRLSRQTSRIFPTTGRLLLPLVSRNPRTLPRTLPLSALHTPPWHGRSAVTSLFPLSARPLMPKLLALSLHLPLRAQLELVQAAAVAVALAPPLALEPPLQPAKLVWLARADRLPAWASVSSLSCLDSSGGCKWYDQSSPISNALAFWRIDLFTDDQEAMSCVSRLSYENFIICILLLYGAQSVVNSFCDDQ